MKQIVSNPELTAYCGLYCGACKSYLSDKCPGCRENKKAAWCKVRTCSMENAYSSCADCAKFSNPNDCKMFNNFVSKMFGFVFRSDRAACIAQIKDIGLVGHAVKMADAKRPSLRR